MSALRDERKRRLSKNRIGDVWPRGERANEWLKTWFHEAIFSRFDMIVD